MEKERFTKQAADQGLTWEAGKPETMEKNDGSGYTILLIDTEDNILWSLEGILRREGYDVLTASRGEEALRLVKDNTVSLIIAGSSLPDMEGLEFFNKVKEISPDTTRLMLRGYTDIIAIMAAISMGAVSRLSKLAVRK